MKKILALLLSLTLVASCLSVPVSFAETKGIDFTIATDLHFESVERVGDMHAFDGYSPTDPYYDSTMQGEMDHISEAIISSFLNEFVNGGNEILLISGDLTDGNSTDHYRLAEMFTEALEKAAKAGKTKRIFVINGNHDIDDDNTAKFTSANDFKTCYYKFGYENAYAVDPDSCSYTADLDQNYRLLAIDSCIYGGNDGDINDARFKWIKEQVQKADAEGKYLITMMHHSVVPHFSVQDIPGNFNDRADKLAALGIRHVFTGHMHGNDIAKGITSDGNVIYDILTGSLITSPCSYREVTYSPESVKIETKYLTSVDADRLPKGLTSQQYELITSDFQNYAKGYFTAGMPKWLLRYIGSAGKLAQKLKIDVGTPAYEALDFVLGCLGKALTMPLYNTDETPGKYDSFEELCDAYGYELPESDYKVPGDVVGNVIGAFYAGDENIKYTDTEIQIAYAVVSAGLVYAVNRLFSLGNERYIEFFFDAVGVRTKVLGLTEAGKIIAGKKCANLLIEIILAPIVEGISTDCYDPADLNVELPGVEAEIAEEGNYSPMSFLDKVKAYFKDFFRIFKECFTNLFGLKKIVC